MMTRSIGCALTVGRGGLVLLQGVNPRNWFQNLLDFSYPRNSLLIRNFTILTSSLLLSSITVKKIIGGTVGHNSSRLSTSASDFSRVFMASNVNGYDRNLSFNFQLSSSSSLKIQKGDITNWFVNGASDAIVNAANERMLGGGGVDGAIHRAAGPELRSACYDVPEVSPGIRCPKGEARITPAFRLPVSHVIHTVGPIYDVDDHPEVTLRNAYRNCLRLAKDNNIQFIAFPAISCGVYGYPYEEAATIAISTVMESDGDFREVHFILFEDDVFDAWIEKANTLL